MATIVIRLPEVESMWGATQEELKKFWLALPKDRQVTTRFEGTVNEEFYSQEFPHMRTIIVDPASMPQRDAKKAMPFFEELPKHSTGLWHANGEAPMFEEKHVPNDEAAAAAKAIEKRLTGLNHQCNAMTASGKRCQRLVRGRQWDSVLDNCFQHNGLK